MKKQPLLSRHVIAVAVLLVFVGQACTLSLFNSNPSTPKPGEVVPSATPPAMAQTNFTVTCLSRFKPMRLLPLS